MPDIEITSTNALNMVGKTELEKQVISAFIMEINSGGNGAGLRVHMSRIMREYANIHVEGRKTILNIPINEGSPEMELLEWHFEMMFGGKADIFQLCGICEGTKRAVSVPVVMVKNEDHFIIKTFSGSTYRLPFYACYGDLAKQEAELVNAIKNGYTMG